MTWQMPLIRCDGVGAQFASSTFEGYCGNSELTELIVSFTGVGTCVNSDKTDSVGYECYNWMNAVDGAYYCVECAACLLNVLTPRAQDATNRETSHI